MYDYFYSLNFSGSNVPIIRRIIVLMRHLVYVILRRWPSGMHTKQSDINQVSHWYNNSPHDGHITVRKMQTMEINVYGKLCVRLAIYKDHTRMHGQQNIKYYIYNGWGYMCNTKGVCLSVSVVNHPKWKTEVWNLCRNLRWLVGSAVLNIIEVRGGGRAYLCFG